MVGTKEQIQLKSENKQFSTKLEANWAKIRINTDALCNRDYSLPFEFTFYEFESRGYHKKLF